MPFLKDLGVAPAQIVDLVAYGGGNDTYEHARDQHSADRGEGHQEQVQPVAVMEAREGRPEHRVEALPQNSAEGLFVCEFEEEEQKCDHYAYGQCEYHEKLDQRPHSFGHLIVEPVGKALF